MNINYLITAFATKYKYYCYTSILSIFIFVFNQHRLLADGWTRQKGTGLITLTSFFQQFNKTTDYGDYDDKEKIFQMQLISFLEYGLTSRITIGGKIILVDNMLTHNNTFYGKRTAQSFGLDMAQVFARFRIFKTKNFTLSFSQSIQTPSIFKKNNVSYYSLQVWQYEPRIEIGVNLTQDDFLTASFGWHGNINHWYDEMRLEIQYGHYLTKHLLFLLRFKKYIYYIKNNGKEVQANYQLINISISDIFAKTGFAKITAVLVVDVGKNTKLEFGAYSTIKTKLFKTENLNLNMKGFFIGLDYEWW